MPRFPLFLLFFVMLGLIAPSSVEAVPPQRSEDSYRRAFDALDHGQTKVARITMYQAANPVLNKVIKGYLLADEGNDYSFDELANFIVENSDWPGLNRLAMVAEQKIPNEATNEQIISWFSAHPPCIVSGLYRYVDALRSTGQTKMATTLIRSWWVEKDFPTSALKAYKSRYSSVLRRADHIARLDRLLWENKVSSSRNMYPYVDKGHKALAEARIALANNKGNVTKLIAEVPASLQHDAGLMYERLRWRRQRGDDKGAMEILLGAPKDLKQPSRWWDEANVMIRRLLEKKDFKRAYRLAANSRLSTGFDYVQSEFIAGWLALRYLKNTKNAHRHFTNLLKESNTPVTRARGYYWLGRTYDAVGQPHDAEQAYQMAASLSTTFYGQLAMTRLNDHSSIHAASEPAVPDVVRVKFFDRDTVRAVLQLCHLGQTDRAYTFFKALGDYSTRRVDFTLLMELAYRLDRPDWAVIAAKAANQKNFILTGGAFPLLSLDLPSLPEAALAHALIRQESHFNPEAGSSVGARGLMQLMPGTAKGIAKKMGLSYHNSRLTDPDYNIKLGTYFIQKQIDNFDGSYVLALAAYNAGPRRARDWIETYGDPRSPKVDAIDWIEMIPIYETRNYIQRIIENLQFYRSRLSQKEVPLMILKDIKR